jgi:hypothetical protein
MWAYLYIPPLYLLGVMVKHKDKFTVLFVGTPMHYILMVHPYIYVCVYIYACLPVGARALGEPWPPLQPVSTWC